MYNPFLRGQEQVSAVRPLAINETNLSTSSTTPSAATVPLYYYTGGNRTIDAGEAAGTVVDFAFAHRNILNSIGIHIGNANDTSIAYTCLALTEEILLESRPDIMALWESLDDQTLATVTAQIGALLTDGQYVINYRWGYGVGKKATTAIEMTTVTYQHSSSAMVTVDSEFPAATVLADGDANPTTTRVGANILLWNGATWDRATSADFGGGGSAGGGNNTYSTEQGDFTATITDATNDVVLSSDSIGGVAITAANLANAILKVYDASTEEMITITLDDFTWTSATKTIDTTNCTGAFTFATGDIVSLTLVGSDKMRNTSADAQKSLEQAPNYTHHIGDTLADVTNETNATNGYYVDVSGYDELYFDFINVAGTDTITLTIEASSQDDGTAQASCDYADISQYGISPSSQAAGAASYTADLSGMIDCKGKKFIKFKTVSSGGANDGDYTLRTGRAY